MGVLAPSGSDRVERAAKNMRKALVEGSSFGRREELALAGPGDRVGEAADAHGEIEHVTQALPPGLQVCVAQPRKPPIMPPQAGALFEKAERHDERKNGCEIELSPQSSNRRRSFSS